MAKNKSGKFLRHLAGIIALRFFILITNILPLEAIYKISHLLAKLAYVFAKKHRRIAKEGLEFAFGSCLDSTAIKGITLSCFEEIVKGALELLVLPERSKVFKQWVSISGAGHLQQALARGKGAICVTAHFGNFPLLLVRLQDAGFPTAVILRPMRDEKIDRYFLERRRKHGMGSIYSKPAKACVDKSLAFLKKNGVLFIQLDQNFGSGRGVFVNFFGRQAATATGPVVLALRSKAAIIPTFIIRGEDNTQEIIIEPEFKIEKQKDYKQTVEYNIARLTEIIEGYIRRYPAQWSWIHRRWKSRPSGG